MQATPEALLDDLWQRLGRGVADRRSPGRVLALSTLDPDLGPSSRMAILRGARRSENALELHTDRRSDKMGHIWADPRVNVLFWDDRAQVQGRIWGRAEVLTGTDVADRWARIPDMGRRVYGGTPPPGTPIPAPEAHDPDPTQADFAVLILRAQVIDILHLAQPRHLRARFRVDQDWAGTWVAP